MSVKKLYELKEEFDKVLYKLVLHNANFDVDVYANLKYRNIIYQQGDKDISYYFEKKDLNVYLDLLHEVYKVELIWYAICPHNILYTSIHSPTDDIFDEYIGIQEDQFGDVNILSSIKQKKDE